MSGCKVTEIDLGFNLADLQQFPPRKTLLHLAIELGEQAEDSAPTVTVTMPQSAAAADNALAYLTQAIPRHVKARMEVLQEAGYNMADVLADMYDAIEQALTDA